MSSPVSTTKYPIVSSKPSLEDCLRTLRTGDYFQWAGATVGSWAYGFMVGRPARFSIASLMAGIGFTFGSMIALQNTRGRLMGLRENGREVAKYGIQKMAPGEGFYGPLDFHKFK